jgi:flagellar basal-body rod protein FlgB
MWLADVVQGGAGPALDKTAAFTEARHLMLSENIANIDTPGYKVRSLDPKLFQARLAEALNERQDDSARPLRLEATKQFHLDARGMLEVTPTMGSGNLLFHDGTTLSIDKEMASLAENTLMHQVAIELTRQRFALLRTAISGRM